MLAKGRVFLLRFALACQTSYVESFLSDLIDALVEGADQPLHHRSAPQNPRRLIIIDALGFEIRFIDYMGIPKKNA
jgi:hypothetical protein